MKGVLLVCLVFLNGVSAQDVPSVEDPSKGGPSNAARVKAAAMTERITPVELAQRKASASNTIASPKFKPVENKPSHAVVKPDLYANTEIIFDGVYHSILPKGCILGYTEELSKSVVEQATGEFMFWPEFYAKNKAWIKLQEVDVATAKGDVPLSEALVKSLQTESKLTVAVYKGNPVTVLEYKGDEKVDGTQK